jgi:hypothetical protein
MFNTFFFATDIEAKLYTAFVPGKPLLLSIILASNAIVYSSGAPFSGLACKYSISQACEE